jgi:hypothetical protein
MAPKQTSSPRTQLPGGAYLGDCRVYQQIQMSARDSPEERLRSLGYSYRSATIGSTRKARRAGM